MNTEIKSAQEIAEQYCLIWDNCHPQFKKSYLYAMEAYRNQFKPEPINSNVWVKIENDLPPLGTMVDGYNKNWINEDFNQEGIRECFLADEGYWTSAEWDNEQDCWDADNKSAPTHWKRRTPPVENLLRDFFLDYSK